MSSRIPQMGSIFIGISVGVAELLCPFRIFRGHRRSMTGRVFGLRAAQFFGLLQPAPSRAGSPPSCPGNGFTPGPARSAETLSPDPDPRPSPVALPLPGRSVPRLCAGPRRACDHLPRCRAKARSPSILPMFQVAERPPRPEFGRDTQRRIRHQAPRSTDRPSRSPSNQG
jgi:hypothetical protein